MLDWIAALFEISGLWIIGNKKKSGFLLLIGCSISWIILGLMHHLYGLSVAACVCFVIHVRNYLKWKRKGNNCEKNN